MTDLSKSVSCGFSNHRLHFFTSVLKHVEKIYYHVDWIAFGLGRQRNFILKNDT